MVAGMVPDSESKQMVPMSRNKGTITIRDVAKAAGVSVSTVSRVLNDKDDVAPETYRKVQTVIKELGYASNLAAKSMRSRSTNVIGLIMPDVVDPFSIQIIKGVNRAIAELDYDLIVYTGAGKSRLPNTSDVTLHYSAAASPMASSSLRLPQPPSRQLRQS